MVGRLWRSLSDDYPLPSRLACAGYGSLAIGAALLGLVILDLWLCAL
jgi:hypothetical protein